MKKIKYLLMLLCFVACNNAQKLPTQAIKTDWKSQIIPAAPQPTTGNAEKGKNYMIYGDFIGSGLPWSFVEKKLTKIDSVLNREGLNQKVRYNLTAFEAANGQSVLAGNCFSCHAGKINGKTMIGLGDNASDFTDNSKFQASMINFLVKRKYKKNSPERAAFIDYGRFIKAIAPNIQTENYGTNPAFRLEEAAVNYRNPIDLTYQKKPNFETIDYTLAADVPPLWNLKKKNALYYNAMGRGNFPKLLMQAAVLGIPDSSYARKVHDNFDDVMQWIKTLEPPKYPKSIDAEKAEKGKAIFEERCSKCHGTYGEKETYPNKLVALSVVKTDPHYARYFTQIAGLGDWYNKSWFATSYPASKLQAEEGYVAPPLDGIWASAPYLHNGSVPSLEALLDSEQRPIYWMRTASRQNYDLENVGLKYTKKENAKEKQTYDTTLKGYGNKGHTFGDVLTKEERSAVIEYLKTL